MATAMKHCVPDLIKPSFEFFDIRARIYMVGGLEYGGEWCMCVCETRERR